MLRVRFFPSAANVCSLGRRCILPVDGFYEWMATKDGKQPYAIAMKDRSPFGIAGIWENWKNPSGGLEADRIVGPESD